MRILQVIQDLAPGGAERVVLSLLRGAEEAGHHTEVAATPGPWTGAVGAPVHPLPHLERHPERVPAGAWAVRRAIAASAPDLVHAHNPGMAIVTALATWRGRRPRALVSFHGVADDEYRAAARVLRLAGLPVVGCGPGVTAALAEHGVTARATIVNGVGPAPAPLDRATLLQGWGHDPTCPLLVCVGRLAPQKDHATAIRALGGVDGAVLAVVGDGELRAELEGVAQAAGVADRVVFTGARDDARAVLGAADAALLPSRWEGLPLVALEVAAGGVPLVATAVRGVRELLTDGVDALLVPAGDDAAMATAVRRVLGDPVLASRLVAGGRAIAADSTEARMVGRFLTLYEELLP